MAGRAHEGEAAAQRRLDRGSRREPGRLVRRLARDRVPVEERRPVDPCDAVDVRLRVAEQELVLECSTSLDEVGKVLQQRRQPLLALRVAAPGRVEPREPWMRQDVDRMISTTSASGRPPCARPTR
jgi:hypothetical protein